MDDELVVLIAMCATLFVVAAVALTLWASRRDRERLRDDVIDEYARKQRRLEGEMAAANAKYEEAVRKARAGALTQARPVPAAPAPNPPKVAPPPAPLPVKEGERDGAKVWRKRVVASMLRMYGMSAPVGLLRRWYNKWVRWLVTHQRGGLWGGHPLHSKGGAATPAASPPTPQPSAAHDAYASFAQTPPAAAATSPIPHRAKPQPKYHNTVLTQGDAPQFYAPTPAAHPYAPAQPGVHGRLGFYPYPSTSQYPSGVMFVNRQ